VTDKLVRKTDTSVPLAADELRRQIDITVDVILASYSSVLRSYVQLGALALEVRNGKHWETWGYPNFNAFVSEIGDRIRKGRTQIYNAISVVERLSPFVESQRLEEMGITNATALARAVRITGKRPSEKLVEEGEKLDSNDYRNKIAEEFRIFDDRPADARWKELGGFWCTPDEWEELQYAFWIARRTDPVIASETPSWAALKEIITRMAQEYVATYAAAVEKGQG
jgi:hypothetical protein